MSSRYYLYQLLTWFYMRRLDLNTSALLSLLWISSLDLFSGSLLWPSPPLRIRPIVTGRAIFESLQGHLYSRSTDLELVETLRKLEDIAKALSPAPRISPREPKRLVHHPVSGFESEHEFGLPAEGAAQHSADAQVYIDSLRSFCIYSGAQQKRHAKF